MTLKKITGSLRQFRVYHKVVGLSLVLFVLVSATTGILLSLKKEVALLQPPTQKGANKDLAGWKPLEELAQTAIEGLVLAQPDQAGNTIDRMDVRPSKGIVKILFENGWWEVQVDGTTGAVLSVAKRHSDWIEALHDGSIISDWFKLISMNFLGLGLLIMLITGVWLWYGPKRYRKLKRVSSTNRLGEK